MEACACSFLVIENSSTKLNLVLQKIWLDRWNAERNKKREREGGRAFSVVEWKPEKTNGSLEHGHSMAC